MKGAPFLVKVSEGLNGSFYKTGVSRSIYFSFSFFSSSSPFKKVYEGVHGCGYANDSVRNSEQVEQGSSKIRSPQRIESSTAFHFVQS